MAASSYCLTDFVFPMQFSVFVKFSQAPPNCCKGCSTKVSSSRYWHSVKHLQRHLANRKWWIIWQLARQLELNSTPELTFHLVFFWRWLAFQESSFHAKMFAARVLKLQVVSSFAVAVLFCSGICKLLCCYSLWCSPAFVDQCICAE